MWTSYLPNNDRTYQNIIHADLEFIDLDLEFMQRKMSDYD